MQSTTFSLSGRSLEGKREKLGCQSCRVCYEKETIENNRQMQAQDPTHYLHSCHITVAIKLSSNILGFQENDLQNVGFPYVDSSPSTYFVAFFYQSKYNLLIFQQIACWNHKLPNTSIPNALREVICPHNIADHLFVKNIQDVKAGDVSIYSHKYNTPQVADVSIYSHKYIAPRVGDVSIYSKKYTQPKGGDITIYNHKYITGKVGDVSIYSHKYIAPQVGDVSIYSHNYHQATDRNPLHRGGDITLYNRKYAIDRDSSPQGGDTILERDPNQGNVEYHRQLLVADPLLSIFFFEKDLHIGTNLMVHLEILKAQYSAYFLPRSIASQIPFSLEKLVVALDVLNIPQGSDMSIAMEEALKKCESPAITGETRYCATSMESMIDYSAAKVGSNHLNVLTTDLPNTFNSQNQQYSVTSMVAKSNSSSTKHVICHSLIYPYAIYMCHEAKGTKIFELSLQGQGTYGTSIPLVAICHADTSGWNPEHAAFMALNVKPGEEAICHFMLEGTIVWLLAN